MVALINRRDIGSKSHLYPESIVPVDQVVTQRKDDARNSDRSRYKHLPLKVPNVEFDVSALIRQNLTSKLKI